VLLDGSDDEVDFAEEVRKVAQHLLAVQLAHPLLLFKINLSTQSIRVQTIGSHTRANHPQPGGRGGLIHLDLCALIWRQSCFIS
jgi:hypothetical protein